MSPTECDGLHLDLQYQDLDGLILLSKWGCKVSTFADDDLDEIAYFHYCIPN